MKSSEAAFAGKISLPAEQGNETPKSRVHISLSVSDLGKSEAFYSTLFGQPPSKEKPDYINFRLDEPAIHLALVPGKAGPQRNCEHFGIELPSADTFKSWEDRLKSTAPDVARPEHDAKCCYARADKVWLSDPDGNRWEIWHRTDDHSSM